MNEMSVTEFAALLESGVPVYLLDVRENEEFEFGALPGAQHVPLGEVTKRIDEIQSAAVGKTTVVYCRAGGRSAQAQEFLLASGIENVFNLTGGLKAYASDVDPSLCVL